MSDGFSAFRAMAVGVGLLLAVTSVAPSVINGHFDGLRLSKGKGKSTLPGDSTGTGSTGGTTTTDSGGLTGSTGGTTGTTSNSFYSEETMVPSNFD
ncbi:MAG TPA: hypothetical protein VF135_04440, partial [Terriglobales bacterium]